MRTSRLGLLEKTNQLTDPIHIFSCFRGKEDKDNAPQTCFQIYHQFGSLHPRGSLEETQSYRSKGTESRFHLLCFP